MRTDTGHLGHYDDLVGEIRGLDRLHIGDRAALEGDGFIAQIDALLNRRLDHEPPDARRRATHGTLANRQPFFGQLKGVILRFRGR